MSAARVRWGLLSLFVGVTAGGLVLATLVDESTGGLTRALAGTVTALTLPAGLALVPWSARAQALDWWDRRSPILRASTVGAAALVTLAATFEAGVSTSAWTTVYVLGAMAGLVLLVGALVGSIAGACAHYGSSWSRAAAAWALGLASGSMLAAAVLGGLTSEPVLDGLDTLLAATAVGVPVCLAASVLGDATLRAWRGT